MPALLPREIEIVGVDDSDKNCDIHGEKQLLPEGTWDVREKLIAIPSSYKVLVRKYKKYACQRQPQCGITSSERPTGIVEPLLAYFRQTVTELKYINLSSTQIHDLTPLSNLKDLENLSILDPN